MSLQTKTMQYLLLLLWLQNWYKINFLSCKKKKKKNTLMALAANSDFSVTLESQGVS